MIKIKLNNSNELDEGRIDDVKKKYPGKDDLVDQFTKAPGNNKYLDWMMRHSDETSPDQMITLINKFHKYNQQFEQKDINSYKTFQDLYDIVSNFTTPKRELEREGTLKIYENDQISISRPLNEEAACKLGANTKWCIAATEGENLFYDYAAQNAYHYIIHLKNLPPSNPMHKFSYTFRKIAQSRLELLEIRDSLNKENDNFSREEIAEKLDNIFGDGESLERKIYDIIFEHASRHIPSHESDEYKLKINYQKLNDLDVERYALMPRNTFFDNIQEIIYNIFFNIKKPTSSFINQQIKKLVDMDNKFINSYFEKILENPNLGGKVGEFINKFISTEIKQALLTNIQSDIEKEKHLKEKRIIDLAEFLYEEPQWKVTLKRFKKNKSLKIEDAVNFISQFIIGYEKEELEKAIKIGLSKLDNEQNSFKTKEEKQLELAELRIFNFNKDKKIFKLLR